MKSFSTLFALRYSFSAQQSHLVAFISRISTFAMVLAVSILITVMSVMNGFDKALKEQILSIVPHATVSGLQGTENWQEKLKQIKEHPQVTSAAPFSQVSSLLVHEDHVKAIMIYGLDSVYEEQDSYLLKLLGKEALDKLKTGKYIIVGKSMASLLDIKPGQQVKLMLPNTQHNEVPLIGFFEVSNFMQTGTELDQKLILMHRYQLAELKGQPKNSVDGIKITVDDLFSSRQIAYDLANETGLHEVQDWSRTHGNLYHAVQMSRKLVLLMVFVIIAVAAFNVISTLILAVNDKAGDIAILRTMGCNRKSILKIFVLQGLFIGLIGSSIGVLLGVIFSLSIGEVVQWIEAAFNTQFLKTEVYPIDHLPSDIHLLDILLVAGVSLLLSVLATIWPAIYASRVEPAKVLRYE